MSADAAGTADARTEKALEARGFADMRPAYRDLLRRLKERNAGAFEEASRRYRDDVVPAIADGGADPIAAWTAYGAWLAGRLVDGKLVSLDDSGFATPADPEPEPGRLLLFLPEDTDQPALPLLRPVELSPAQQAALELLVR